MIGFPLLPIFSSLTCLAGGGGKEAEKKLRRVTVTGPRTTEQIGERRRENFLMGCGIRVPIHVFPLESDWIAVYYVVCLHPPKPQALRGGACRR